MRGRKRKDITRKIMVFVLVLSLLVPQFGGALTAYGTPDTDVSFAGGTGTALDPYLIASPEQLNHVREHLASSFALVADINLSAYQAGEGWNPIGAGGTNTPFSGNFDGGFHKITGLVINRPTSNFVGLFSSIACASKDLTQIKNLVIENANIVGRSFTGGLAGQVENAHIEKVGVTGIVSGYNSVGGLIGNLGLADKTVVNCYSLATVTGKDKIGGLVGATSASTIEKSYAAGNVVTTGVVVDMATGDLVGMNANAGGEASPTVISACYFKTTNLSNSNNGLGTPMLETAMKDVTNSATNFVGWNFTPVTGVWEYRAGENNGYPVFINPENIAPVLASGDVVRVNHTTATVKFTSTKAGKYYYKVVENDAVSHVIDKTTGELVCVAGENTLSITNLTRGDKDLYIVAKNAFGKFSNGLKIDITGTIKGPAITGITSPFVYNAGGEAVKIAPNCIIPPSGSYADGFLKFSIKGGSLTETMALITVSTPSIVKDMVSVVGDNIYIGNGASADLIGKVNGTSNGTQGKDLQIDISSPLTNGGFEEATASSIPGWTINKNVVVLGSLADKTQGRVVTMSGKTVNGTGYSYTSDVSYSREGHEVVSNANYGVICNYGIAIENGNKKLQLTSNGNVKGSVNVQPFGSIFGPEAISAPFAAKLGDSIGFDWKAAGGFDDYEVYGFLEKLDSTGKVEAGGVTQIMYGRGKLQDWATAVGEIPADGTYQYRFVCGTYDHTGGLSVGASLYIDNIRIFKAVNAEAVQQIARLATYKNTAIGAVNKEINVSAKTMDGVMGEGSAVVNVSPTPSPSTGGSGGGGRQQPSTGGTTVKVVDPISTPANEAPKANEWFNVVVNGEKQEIAGGTSDQTVGNQKQLTVTLDQEKVNAILAKIDTTNLKDATIITVPVSSSKADIIVSELNGQMVHDMDSKAVVLEFKTERATYTLPAAEINIDAVAKALGENIALKDVKVSIEIKKPADAVVKEVEDAVGNKGLALVVPPVEFNVTCTVGDKTVKVDKFESYVERLIAIPEGVDPSKITTAIVVDPDGKTRHVPTKVTKIGDKYYAEINSLTNSVYSVVWNPLSFKDTKGVWAGKEMDEAASRMIMSGITSDLYNPRGTISRGDFVATIVKALGLKESKSKSIFKDVKATDKNVGYIMAAYEYGLIRKDGKGLFNPSKPIIRKNMMEMILNATKLTKLDIKTTKAEAKTILTMYKDTKKTSKATNDMVVKLNKANIMSYKSFSTIRENEKVKRSEAAHYVLYLLKSSKLID